MSWPRYFTEEELQAMDAERIAEGAIARVRDGCAPPDALYKAMAELHRPHELRAFMRVLQKQLERQASPARGAP